MVADDEGVVNVDRANPRSEDMASAVRSHRPRGVLAVTQGEEDLFVVTLGVLDEVDEEVAGGGTKRSRSYVSNGIRLLAFLRIRTEPSQRVLNNVPGRTRPDVCVSIGLQLLE